MRATQLFAACWLEATAPKLGNVHPAAPFDDLTYNDFLRAARAAVPVLAQAESLGVGRTLLEAVRATRAACSTNVNLGIVLLLAPLAAVPAEVPLRDGVGRVLEALTVEDAVLAYEAIRLAQPGGLGQAPDQDVAQPPTKTLLEAMRLAAGRDAVAAEYASGFAQVFDCLRPRMARARGDFPEHWSDWIVRWQIELLAERPDTLIARKCGAAAAAEASARARALLDASPPGRALEPDAAAALDDWLRADGHRRNPGSTADLLAAGLFAAFRERVLDLPPAVPVCET